MPNPARATYGIAVTVNGAAIEAVLDVTPPSLQAIEPIDDSRHGDSDGIARFIPSGRKEYTDLIIQANDVASCPGIAAAVAAVITRPSAGGVITVSALVQSVVLSPNPLTGKREVTITAKPSPARA
jgi:hypothetical protein